MDSSNKLFLLDAYALIYRCLLYTSFSSSLPMEIQIAALKQIPAFKDLVIYRPGYAIT